jgi:hypothetical protein
MAGETFLIIGDRDGTGVSPIDDGMAAETGAVVAATTASSAAQARETARLAGRTDSDLGSAVARERTRNLAVNAAQDQPRKLVVYVDQDRPRKLAVHVDQDRPRNIAVLVARDLADASAENVKFMSRS